MIKRRNRSKGRQAAAGFTLTEVLIATAISTIVLLGLYLLYDVNQATFIRGEQQADIQQNARIGMDRIVRELRLAGFEAASPGLIPAQCTPAIQVATATSIRFLVDLDADGTTERVEYTLDPVCSPDCIKDPPKIRREEWPSYVGPNCATDWAASGGAQPFADRVATLAFAYYDVNNNCLGGGAPCGAPPNAVPAASLGNIRRISITITTADVQTGRVPQPFRLWAEVRPRNL